jgi:hypothetical protein
MAHPHWYPEEDYVTLETYTTALHDIRVATNAPQIEFFVEVSPEGRLDFFPWCLLTHPWGPCRVTADATNLAARRICVGEVEAFAAAWDVEFGRRRWVEKVLVNFTAQVARLP